MKVKDLIEKLQRNYNPDDHVAHVLWCAEDVRGISDEAKALSDEDCANILADLERNHDCNHGITWDHIDCAVDFFLATVGNPSTT